ncbi:hypothetical protein QFZ91_000750 [Paraburkholderia sp. JPY419]
MKHLSKTFFASVLVVADVTGSGVGAAGSSPSTRSSKRKANGLNMGTRDGANSDVNRPRNGPRQDGQ